MPTTTKNSDLSSSTSSARSVCIVEGGGARAAFVFGAAATLFMTGQLPKLIFATSAGALAALFAATGELAGGTRFLLTIKEYIRLGHPVFDVEKLVLDLDRAGLIRVDRLAAQGIDLRVGTLEAESGEAVFLPLDARSPLAKLAATMALPGLTAAPVEVDGRMYCDGAPAALAVNTAASSGAQLGYALLTRTSRYRRSPPSALTQMGWNIWGRGLGQRCRERYIERWRTENAGRDAIFASNVDGTTRWIPVAPATIGEIPGRYTRNREVLVHSMQAGALRAAQAVTGRDAPSVVDDVIAELSRGFEHGRSQVSVPRIPSIV